MTAAHTPAFPAPRFDTPPRLLLVVSPYYRGVADALLAGATAVAGQANATVETIDAPGALEIGPMIRFAAASGRFDGFVALGCVIRGETSHYDIVAGESARAITDLGLRDGLAIGNGILTVDTLAQAEVRAAPASAGGQDKGGGATIAALALIAAQRRFGAGRGRTPAFRPDDEHILLA